jgi:hypothetical protein
VEIPQGGSEGMLATLGGRFGGYGFYVLKGKPVFTYNVVDLERFRWEGAAALTPGKHTIVFDFKYDGPGPGKGGAGVLSVDGNEVASKTIPHTARRPSEVARRSRTPGRSASAQRPVRMRRHFEHYACGGMRSLDAAAVVEPSWKPAA